jgi:hypothetical protein
MGKGEAFRSILSGRNCWALGQMRKSEAEDCTPIHETAPRWDSYVHNLRGLGLETETITEDHEGDLPGHHAHHVLRSGMSLGWKGGAA